MKPLRDGIVMWLIWAAGVEGYWFLSCEDNDYDDCVICGERFRSTPHTKEMWVGLIKHGLSHIRAAGVRRSTIEALEALATLVGEKHAAERLLGHSPEKKVD